MQQRVKKLDTKFSVVINSEIKQWLEQRAALDSRKLSDFVRLILYDYYEQHHKELDKYK